MNAIQYQGKIALSWSLRQNTICPMHLKLCETSYLMVMFSSSWTDLFCCLDIPISKQSELFTTFVPDSCVSILLMHISFGCISGFLSPVNLSSHSSFCYPCLDHPDLHGIKPDFTLVIISCQFKIVKQQHTLSLIRHSQCYFSHCALILIRCFIRHFLYYY